MFFKPTANAQQREDSLLVARDFGREQVGAVRALLGTCPAYAATPLLSLDSMARRLGIAALSAKDERARLGLGSFKAVGGAYAVLTLAAEAIGLELGRAVTPAELVRGEHRPRRPLMFATASAGNHGCAVAAAARLVQASCTVFLPDGVPSAMQRTMRGYGADLVSVTGVYEDAVAACQQRAAQAGWCLVSDTSWEGYRDPAIRVQLGYSVIAAEVQEQAQEAPTHVFIQAGVGGLAAAWAAFLALAWAPPVPRLLVVEPNRAACLLASAQAGRSVRVRAELPTNMGRLQCYEPSLVAWLQLRGLADAFVAISDDEAESASDLLAASELVTSPSGAAGLAGLSHVLADPVARAALSLDDHSRALIVITEAKPRPD